MTESAFMSRVAAKHPDIASRHQRTAYAGILLGLSAYRKMKKYLEERKKLEKSPKAKAKAVPNNALQVIEIWRESLPLFRDKGFLQWATAMAPLLTYSNLRSSKTLRKLVNALSVELTGGSLFDVTNLPGRMTRDQIRVWLILAGADRGSRLSWGGTPLWPKLEKIAKNNGTSPHHIRGVVWDFSEREFVVDFADQDHTVLRISSKGNVSKVDYGYVLNLNHHFNNSGRYLPLLDL